MTLEPSLFGVVLVTRMSYVEDEYGRAISWLQRQTSATTICDAS